MVNPEGKPSRDDMQGQLRSVQEQCERLREKNARLRTMLGIPESVGAGTASPSHADGLGVDASKSGGNLFTPEGKITLRSGPRGTRLLGTMSPTDLQIEAGLPLPDVLTLCLIWNTL